ncbi:MAG: glycosyltransferase, partial [Bacteroidetes bacterium]
MQPNPKISVLLSVYNTDFYLVKRAIDSVLNQDYPNFELILIDDGSSNESSAALLKYAKKYEDKIVFIRH